MLRDRAARSFENVGGHELLAGLSRVVSKRNQLTAEFLAYLAELDERQLFLDLGYPSLFGLPERVRGLAGQWFPSGDLLTLLKRGLGAYERELEKERFAVGRKPRAARHADVVRAAVPSETDASGERRSLPGKRKRARSAAVAREVFVRDGKLCSYVSADGRRCASRRCLELDHVQPWALGGSDSAANLRVRCRAHNQRYARQCFGELHVRAARARKRRQEQAL